MDWLHHFFRAPTAAAAVGASGRLVEVSLAAPLGRYGGARPRRSIWTRLWDGCRGARRQTRRRRPSAIAHHVLRDIGLTPVQAQFMGLSIDWRP